MPKTRREILSDIDDHLQAAWDALDGWEAKVLKCKNGMKAIGLPAEGVASLFRSIRNAKASIEQATTILEYHIVDVEQTDTDQ
jgi:hypothetical protein